MKRFLSLLLVLLLSLTLSACKSKEAAAAEELIAAIGEVTLESGTAIANAELAYNALSDKDRESVENAAVMTDARAAFDRLADVDAKIKAIGEVSFDSADAIDAARSAFDALPDAQKAAVPALAALESAETALAAKLVLAGEWGLNVDLSTVEEFGLREALGDIAASGDVEIPSIMLPILLTLGEDGTLGLEMDQAQFDANSESFMDALCDLTMNMVYAQLKQEGVAQEQADQIIQTYYGMDMRSYCMTLLEQLIDIDDLGKDIAETGYYDVDGDKLYVWEEGARDDASYLIFERKGDQLTVTEAFGEGKELLPDTLLPAVFDKQ